MRLLIKLTLLCILVILEAGCMGRLSLQQGIESFRAQDYRQAFIRLKPEAIKGQPDAEYAVGYMYYYGQGVVEDRKLAWYWINRAAARGQSDACAAVKILGDKRT
jgi:TPR repeat protein